jgi:anti-sigma factor RsiW
MNDDPFHDWDAAYVLGLLGPDDRRAFEQHLTTCDSCSAAVAELAGMPGILATLSKEEAVALLEPEPVDEPASDGLVTRLAVAAGRRRRRVRLAIAGAGVAAALGLGIGGYVLGSADDPTPPSGQFVAMSPVKPGIMTASLRVEKKAWGTKFDWNCHYLAAGGYGATRVYELVITDTSGHETVAASWVATSPMAASLSTTSAVPKDSIRRVEIRLAGSAEPLTETEL